MDKPSSKSRISARTAPEIISGAKMAVLRLADRGLQFRNRKLGIEGFLGSVLLEILDRDDDELQAILERRLPEVERLFTKAGVPEEAEKGVGITPLDPPSMPLGGPKRGGRKPR